MPIAPGRACRRVGCRALIGGLGVYCKDHAADAANVTAKRYGKQRGTTDERGYGWRWQKIRRDYLSAHPLCVICRARGIIESATVVDHITPHKGDDVLFWDSERNWQPLCIKCHNTKTARLDGGFGNVGKGGDDTRHTPTGG